MTDGSGAEISDAEIGRRLRVLLELTEERERQARTAERLRYSDLPEEQLERDESGAWMAELDLDVIPATAMTVFSGLGLWNISAYIESAMDAHRASEDPPA